MKFWKKAGRWISQRNVAFTLCSISTRLKDGTALVLERYVVDLSYYHRSASYIYNICLPCFSRFTSGNVNQVVPVLCCSKTGLV